MTTSAVENNNVNDESVQPLMGCHGLNAIKEMVTMDGLVKF